MQYGTFKSITFVEQKEYDHPLLQEKNVSRLSINNVPELFSSNSVDTKSQLSKQCLHRTWGMHSLHLQFRAPHLQPATIQNPPHRNFVGKGHLRLRRRGRRLACQIRWQRLRPQLLGERRGRRRSLGCQLHIQRNASHQSFDQKFDRMSTRLQNKWAMHSF